MDSKVTKLEGYDFGELAEYFEIQLDSDKDDLDERKSDSQCIVEWLRINGYKDYQPKVKVVDVFRSWLKLFLSKKDEEGSAQLFLGLSKIEDNHCFMRYFSILMPSLWI